MRIETYKFPSATLHRLDHWNQSLGLWRKTVLVTDIAGAFSFRVPVLGLTGWDLDSALVEAVSVVLVEIQR